MGEYEVIEQDRLREVAQWMAAWERPPTEADSIARAADFGWTVIDEDPGSFRQVCWTYRLHERWTPARRGS